MALHTTTPVAGTLTATTPIVNDDVVLAPIPKSASFTVTADDDGKVFDCRAALTVTYPEGLSPRPQNVYIAPASGDVTIAVTGGALINGAGTSLTRSRSSNRAGFVVQPYSESDGYGVSGS